jgi:hypothetical protein
MRSEINYGLPQILVGLRFPAQRWQILTQAGLYGVDSRTRELFERLPAREYRSYAEIAAALAQRPQIASARVSVHRPVPAPRTPSGDVRDSG